MGRPIQAEADFRRTMSTTALVIAIATVVWLLLGEVGRQYGWDGRFALLIDLAAMAAYVWALVNAWMLWRKRRDN